MRDFITQHRGFLLGLALVAMTLAAYLPAMTSGGFIWDDDDYVIHNKTLRDAKGLKDIWADPQATPQYYPLVHTSYWVEYRLWGLDPTGYHVNNVLLHALAAVLLWRVLLRLKIPGAWLAAALFAVHPVHVESVAWVTERKNVLSGVFYLGAAWAYLKWIDAKAGGEKRPSSYFAACILFVCALLSKTVTASLPAALLLVMWWKDDRGQEPEAETAASLKTWVVRRVPPLVPLFLVGMILSGLTVWLEKHHVGAKGAEWHLSFIDRCLVAGRALWFYIGKLLWPAKLTFSYPRWEIDATVWWQYLYPLAFAAVLVLFWLLRKRLGRGPLVAMLFFAGTLLPALGFLDVYPFRYSFVADHFQYHASIGVLVLAASTIVCGCRRAWAKGRMRFSGTPPDGFAAHLACGLPGAAILLVFVILSANQCGIYRDLETLWFDTIDKNPVSWMAYNNLGKLYLDEGRPAEAIPFLEKSLQLYPQEMTTHSNLGAALARLGRYDEAMAVYQKAIEIDPDDPMAYNNLGAAYARQNLYEKALPCYRKALEIDPSLAATHVNLATVLASLGRIDDAILHHEKSLELAPDFGTVHLKYGQTMQAAGRIREAAHHYRKAVELDPSLAEAHYHLGMIAVADQLLPAALAHFRDAVAAAPNFAEAHSNLAKVLVSIGRLDQAEKHFRQAAALAPRSGPIRLDYAAFLAQRGDNAAARREFLEAAKVVPDNPEPFFQAGVIDQQLGDTAAAEAHFRAVLQRVPDHAPACNHLAVLLAGQGKNDDAVELLRRAVKLAPDNAEFHNNLGVILVRAGKRAEALEALDTAVRLNPDYDEAKKNLEDLRKLMDAAPRKP